ncbi:molybdopterin-dependent oxidoreductase [Shimia sp.]|uniref:molybdopterin-dependent oxidoreductase n=1 Tax=Shimia sp. TaxID=1954381 RepID=UPI00329708C8
MHANDPKPAPTCTTCPYCGTGCGVLATPDGAGGLQIKGDPDHPANFGRLCSKGSALGETVDLDGRLLTPQIDNRPAGWDEALDLVASRFQDTIARHGPDSVAFYVSGQLLTEDYYVANKLMKGFIGSANIDTNSRLCMASTVAGHKRAFGTDTVPGTYEDLEQADLIVLVGSNLAWCHPVLYQRIAAAKTERPNMRVVTIDPRRTATTDLADLHLPLKAGTDVALFNRLLTEIYQQGAVNADFVTKHVTGFNDALDAASTSDVTVTGLPHTQITEFLNLWLRTEKVVTVFSQGVNQSAQGADKVNAILNCHLATGRIGQPGMGPFSVTGQPNAMGGREVGGLANMLACHLDIENPDHRALVGGFWSAPAMPEQAGLKAVDMFRAVSDGRIKALWIMCTNPAVSLPQANFVRDAIQNCDFTVVSDLTATTDTARLANVVLPATGWGEKDGTVTNSDRTISRQRPVLPKPGQARHDWDIISDVGRRMGWQDAFDFAHPAEIFREHAALSGYAAAQGKDFDISGLADITNVAYEALRPTRWPVPGQAAPRERFFADGQFFTPSGRANMLPVEQLADDAPFAPSTQYRLNTGRIRDQWHTMTRTGRAARLSQHYGEPFLEINPEDAFALGLRPADLAQVETEHGHAVLRVLVTDRVRPGAVFAPIHWTTEFASAGRICAVLPDRTDPVSGQPDSKGANVSIKPYAPEWYGFAVGHHQIIPHTDYWATARHATGWRTELAGRSTPADWEHFAQDLFRAPDARISSVIDHAKGTARIALHKDNTLIGALFTAPDPVSVARTHVANLIGSSGTAVLAGHPGMDQPDPGATVCACFNVGVNTIIDAITSQKLISVDQIGVALQAGSNCGSCRPELAALLNATQGRAAAE